MKVSARASSCMLQLMPSHRQLHAPLVVDHQSAVRSVSLNFINDLPRFVVFLWIPQRLTREGWGYVPIMGPTPNAGAEERSTVMENAEAKAKTKEKPKTNLLLTAPTEIKCRGVTYFTDGAYARKHHIWGLNGRKTCVRKMRRRRNPEVAVAVKVALQKESRASKQEVFDEISRLATEANALSYPFPASAFSTAPPLHEMDPRASKSP